MQPGRQVINAFAQHSVGTKSIGDTEPIVCVKSVNGRLYPNPAPVAVFDGKGEKQGEFGGKCEVLKLG